MVSHIASSFSGNQQLFSKTTVLAGGNADLDADFGRAVSDIPVIHFADGNTVFLDDVAAVKLWDAPESYQSMTEKRLTSWPQSCMVPGILEYMDLPDIYEAIAAFKPFSASFVNEPLPEM